MDKTGTRNSELKSHLKGYDLKFHPCQTSVEEEGERDKVEESWKTLGERQLNRDRPNR